MLRLLVVSCVAGVLAGCGRGDFALQVQVTAPAGSRSVCTKVTATRGSESLESDSATLSASDPVDIIIALDSAAAVTVQAAGYDNAGCLGAPVEQSEQRAGTPTKGAPFPVVALTLAPLTTDTDGGTDAGFDGGIDDAGFDGGVDDAGVDGGADAGFDGGLDDAGFDGGTNDAGFDDAGAPDAGPACTLATVGQSCAGATGTCNFEGACIANFPYVPSNFTEADLPATDSGVFFVVNNNVTINTDDGTVLFATAPPFRFLDSDAGYAKVMVIHVDGFTVNAGNTLTINGANPVIIAVSGDANIAGTISANAGSGPTPLCGSSLGANGGVNTTGSGAGGGGFGAVGGHGGEGYNGGMTSGAGGTSSGAALLAPLRGGCAGGRGGNNGGTGGVAGGAVELAVSGFLQASGTISAAGEGGNGGSNSGRGGGGGGSGGAILCEANRLVLTGTAKLTANGGGGGGGGGGGQSGSGSKGDDGHAFDASPADGGTGGSGGWTGQPGGTGSTATSEATDGGSGSGGGGGGGGGVGRIRFNANSACINPGAVISPAQTTNGGAFAFDAGC